MHMNCDKPTYQYLPYEVLYLVPNNQGHWGSNWRVHSKHNTREERDQEFDKCVQTKYRRYRKALNEYEYDAMIAAEYRYEQAQLHKPTKVDDTDIAGALNLPVGIDPASNYVCWREL